MLRNQHKAEEMAAMSAQRAERSRSPVPTALQELKKSVEEKRDQLQAEISKENEKQAMEEARKEMEEIKEMRKELEKQKRRRYAQDEDTDDEDDGCTGGSPQGRTRGKAAAVRQRRMTQVKVPREDLTVTKPYHTLLFKYLNDNHGPGFGGGWYKNEVPWNEWMLRMCRVCSHKRWQEIALGEEDPSDEGQNKDYVLKIIEQFEKKHKKAYAMLPLTSEHAEPAEGGA